jgi:serine/threonine protein kinase
VSSQLEVGQVVDGRYVVEGILGIGGLAEVYRVRHQKLGSLHALKVLTVRRRGVDARLEQEGRIQSQLRHPNVVLVNDVVMIDDHPGLVMEYVDGTDLAELLHQRGRLTPDDALALMAPVLAAVAHAHSLGAVHRDLKPANILLGRTPVGLVPKVADFGIGKLIDATTGEGSLKSGATRAGMAMGTPGYMPPEQVKDSSTVDQRADVFALGVILYELMAGRPPFRNPDGTVDLTSTVVREAPPLASQAADVPAPIADAVHRALAKEPEDRLPTVRALVDLLGLSSHPLFLESPTGGLGVTSAPAVPITFSTSTFGAGPTAVPPTTVSTPPSVVAAPSGAGSPAVMPKSGVAVLVALPAALALVVVAGALALGSMYLAMGPGDEPVGAVVAPPPTPPTPPAPPVEPAVDPAAVDPGEPVPTDAPAPSLPAPQVTAPTPGPAPVEPAPVEPAPVEPAPAEPAPVEPAPAEPAPVVAAVTPAPAPAPAPTVIDASGRWSGTANNRPLALSLTVTGTTARGDLSFTGTTRVVKLSGVVDPATGVVTLRSDDGVRLDGRVTGSVLTGSYALGSAKSVPFRMER